MNLAFLQIILTKTKKDILSLISANIVYKLIGYLVLVFVARYLGKEVMGKYLFAISFVGLFIILSELGINPLLVRNISHDKSITQKYMSAVMGLRLILSICCLGIILIITYFFQRKIWIIIFLTTIFMLMEGIYYSVGSLFLAYQKVKYSIICGIITKLFLISLIIFAIHYNFSLVGILWIHIVCGGFMLFLAIFIARTKITRISINFNWNLYKQIIKQSLPFALLTLIGLILYKVDMVMLGFMKTYNEVGIYGAGFKLLEAISFIPTSIAMILYPQMAELHLIKSELNNLFRKVIKWFFLPTLFSVLLVIPFTEIIISTIYGDNFMDAALVFKIIYLTIPLVFLNTIIVSLFKAINKEKILIPIVGFSLLLKIILNLYLIPIYSYLGVAITKLIVDAVQSVIFGYYLRKYLNQPKVSRHNL